MPADVGCVRYVHVQIQGAYVHIKMAEVAGVYVKKYCSSLFFVLGLYVRYNWHGSTHNLKITGRI